MLMSGKRFWDRIAKLYAPLMEKDASFYDEICDNIRPYLTKDMDVLELACGSGQLSFRLYRHTKSWIGTDFSHQMIAEAKKRGDYDGLSFTVADATSLISDAETFDCVVIANALHIMPNPDEAMREIHRVLKPNGVLCAPTFLWTEEKPKKYMKTLMSLIGFKMYNEWNKEQFRDYVSEYGFSVVEITLVKGALAPVGVLIANKN